MNMLQGNSAGTTAPPEGVVGRVFSVDNDEDVFWRCKLPYGPRRRRYDLFTAVSVAECSVSLVLGVDTVLSSFFAAWVTLLKCVGRLEVHNTPPVI
jgi:hypothetical protein